MRASEPYTIFLRTLPSGKQVYYYQFRDDNGTRSGAHSTGMTSLSKAKRYVQKLYNGGELTAYSSMTFGAFTRSFFDENSEYVMWKKANTQPLKPETVRAYNKSLNNQLLPFFSVTRITDITTSLIKQWVIWASEKWSAKTVNNAQGVLSIILSQAVEKNIIKANPSLGVSFRKTKKKDRKLLTVDELNLLYHQKWANESNRQMFLVACITGMRIGEVSALRSEDVSTNYLNVRHTFSSRYGIGTTKTDIKRYVPIPSCLNLRTDTEWCFPSPKNKNRPIQSHAVYNNMTRICDRLGIDRKARGITIHSLRNFFISYLQAMNVTESKIRAVVGHKDETMTDLYTVWTPDMFPEVYDAQKKLYDEITKG